MTSEYHLKQISPNLETALRVESKSNRRKLRKIYWSLPKKERARRDRDLDIFPFNAHTTNEVTRVTFEDGVKYFLAKNLEEETKIIGDNNGRSIYRGLAILECKIQETYNFFKAAEDVFKRYGEHIDLTSAYIQPIEELNEHKKRVYDL